MKLWIFLFIFYFSSAYAQLQEQSSLYKSQTDELLTIKKIAVLPSTDNTGGIYSRPIEQTIKKQINSNHHWDLVRDDSVGAIITPMELEAEPERAKELVKNINADAAILAQSIKGPSGLTLKVHLYLIKDGRLLSKSELRNSNKFEVHDVTNEIQKLVSKTLNKIPYNGLILSRTGLGVTLNLGLNDGIEVGQTVTVVQIIKANFHPKFNFLISTEKEILGKVKIAKVDKTLSFGQIVTEVDRLAIQKNAKIVGLDMVQYGNNTNIYNQNKSDRLQLRPDNKISFGKNPSAWVPKKPPTFGSVSAGLALGSFSSDIRRSSSSYKTSDSFGKNIAFNGELWITPKYTIHAGLQQGIVSNNSSSHYDLLLGYNYRFGNDVWSPYVEFLAGFASYAVDVNDLASSITQLTYSGFKWGVSGLIPVTIDRTWAIGAKLFMFLSPSLKQTPFVSAASSITANHFSIFGHKKLGENLKLDASLDIELYTSKFNSSTESSSQQSTMLSSGITYMF